MTTDDTLHFWIAREGDRFIVYDDPALAEPWPCVYDSMGEAAEACEGVARDLGAASVVYLP